MSRVRKHVYLEKPFTITAERSRIFDSTWVKACGLKITAGHNCQFTLEMLEMRRLVSEGFLGGKPIHLESYFSLRPGRQKLRRRTTWESSALGATIAGAIVS